MKFVPWDGRGKDFELFSGVQNLGYFLYIRDYTTQLYIGIVISQYKDPYEPATIIELN